MLYLIYDGKYKPQDIIDTEKYFGSINKDVHDVDQEGFAKDLVDLGNSYLNYLQPIDQAGQMWLKWRNELDERVSNKYKDNMYDIQTVYLGKMAVNTLKLAGIHRYSRLCRDPNLKVALQTEDTEVIMPESGPGASGKGYMMPRWPGTQPTEVGRRSARKIVRRKSRDAQILGPKLILNCCTTSSRRGARRS